MAEVASEYVCFIKEKKNNFPFGRNFSLFLGKKEREKTFSTFCSSLTAAETNYLLSCFFHG
jgi:hypothetical protein